MINYYNWTLVCKCIDTGTVAWFTLAQMSNCVHGPTFYYTDK